MTFADFRDFHKGETCVVIGNGPSLNAVPLHFLDSHPTFGTNRIYLRYIPLYYCAVNPLVIRQNFVDILALPCDKFLPRGYNLGHELNITRRREFSCDAEQRIYEGYTVTFVCLQLAYFMGFTTVLLVGVDHRYDFQGKPNEERVMLTDDPNHFDPAYFKGQAWHNPDLMQSETAYTMAEIAFREAGRKIINLTEGSALEVFERGRVEEYA